MRIIPPNFFLDPSTFQGSQSPWLKVMKMKKSIILVCRSWYFAGIPFLYEDIAFLRLPQIPAFVRTIKALPHGGKLGQLVKGITLYAYIPQGYGESFNTHMACILSDCPRLERFIFNSPCSLPSTARFPSITPSITYLSLNQSVSFAAALDILDGSVGERLTRLAINASDVYDNFQAEKIRHLPRLVDLLVSNVDENEEAAAVQILVDTLSIPHLKRLTLVSRSRFGGAFFMPFFEKHGRTLQFVHFLVYDYPYRYVPGRNTGDLQSLLNLCPVLEHLVVDSIRARGGITHPTVKWVDMCISAGQVPNWETSVWKAGFPACRGFREICASVTLMRDIPSEIPPSMVASQHDTFELVFPGVNIYHNVGRMDVKYYLEHWESSLRPESPSSDCSSPDFNPAGGDTSEQYDSGSEATEGEEDETDLET
ncbi:hypothetical protein H0H81_011616 [Sphagnurus paluster]|uniref:Uncharacterized protein n=1 Tax=Sphagnurus paluster TaxID=117069 RepID=A0A9P7KNL3_9AGAR|nr:hypothetical protein H0H81_011616 [Sphagnurus paluster]